jgi:Domain of unknown function (DUF5680)
MTDTSLLLPFIIRAKKATYLGDAAKAKPSRAGSHDLIFEDGAWTYGDSYFGGTDFLGQEVVWCDGEPIWAMNYHGTVLRPDLMDGERAAATFRAAHARADSQGRLIDNFQFVGAHGVYVIACQGDVKRFKGGETISVDGVVAYALDFNGGMITP